MPKRNRLILEIFKEEKSLKMSLFRQEDFSSTLRNYSRQDFNIKEIEKICLELQFILSSRKKEADSLKRLEKIGQVLWSHVFSRQVRDKLKSILDGELSLFIDEELVDIPWEILFDGKEFLCLKFSLGRLVRTKEQLVNPQYRANPVPLKVLILANPTGDLKSAYQEGLLIKSLLDKRRKHIVVDFKSTSIDTIFVKKNIPDYDIIHFAGHCDYDHFDAQNSGWVLNDGRISGADVMAMANALSMPQLVFSNACHSASEIQEASVACLKERNYGLASAFIFSGVKHYIGTIRKVEDDASLVFAREFYIQLFVGKEIGDAFRQARIKLILEYGKNNIAWTSYLLYGDPAFRLFIAKEKKLSLLAHLGRFIRMSRIKILSLFILVLIVSAILFINPNRRISLYQLKKLYQTGENAQVVNVSENLIGNSPGLLEVYPILADVYYRMGDTKRSIKTYFDFCRQSEQAKDMKNLAKGYLGLGWIYHLRGDYPKAKEFYLKALELAVKEKDYFNEAVSLRKLAVWNIDQSQYNSALELLTRSMELDRKYEYVAEHRYNLACDYFDLGLVFTNKEDYTTAKNFYEKSKKLFEKLKLRNELSDCCFNLGEICLFEKEYQKAMDYYKVGLKIDQGQGNKVNIVSDFNMLGELCLEMDNLDEAGGYFTQALELAKEIDSPKELSVLYYNMAVISRKLGKKDKVREFLVLAQENCLDKNSAECREIESAIINSH